MKQSCPDCKTIVEIDESEFDPGNIVVRECPLCGSMLKFKIPPRPKVVVRTEKVYVENPESARQEERIKDLEQELRDLRDIVYHRDTSHSSEGLFTPSSSVFPSQPFVEAGPEESDFMEEVDSMTAENGVYGMESEQEYEDGEEFRKEPWDSKEDKPEKNHNNSSCMAIILILLMFIILSVILLNA
ncbi:MAG: hypothetical protein J5711_01290 [Bacteroidales bacterium]|nr:hypothetical protein [Bacteroidales bacterium]